MVSLAYTLVLSCIVKVIKNLHCGDINYWIVDEQEYEIHEQEIIFIPAQSMHEVYKSDGKRLALTINLGYGD